MKPKQLSTKLSLSKHTVADLSLWEQGRVLGGGDAPPTAHTCYAMSCPSDCPCPTQITCAITPNQCAHP